MCPPAEDIEGNKMSSTAAAPAPAASQLDKTLINGMLIFCGVVTVTAIAAAIALGIKANEDVSTGVQHVQSSTPDVFVNTGELNYASTKGPDATNPCEDTKLTGEAWDNVKCVAEAIAGKPQSGANVTKGYKGSMNVDHAAQTEPYWKMGMCPVNVHWHLGAEHYSLGQYDETGTAPVYKAIGSGRRALAEADDQVRAGYKCKYYNEDEPKFNKPYVWKHCIGMEIGETYEVHWPHSSLGACGTMDQYQTPFYDGVFCHTDRLVPGKPVHEQVGVHAQVFTIVNDESYFYPDLIRGMVVDGADMGSDVAKYSGSTTGTSRDNDICSQYSPITWHVDRKCHMVSASSFDKMCADMKAQRDDMTDDLYAHGSRELVADKYAAGNGVRQL